MRYLFLCILLSGCISNPVNQNRDYLRYNYYENKYEYSNDKEKLRYNYYENKWEFAK